MAVMFYSILKIEFHHKGRQTDNMHTYGLTEDAVAELSFFMME